MGLWDCYQMIYQKEIEYHFLIFTFAYKIYRTSILINLSIKI